MKSILSLLAVGLLGATVFGGCAETAETDDLAVAEEALGTSNINQARSIDTTKTPTTTDWWGNYAGTTANPSALDKAVAWNLPVSVTDNLATGFNSGTATMTFCTTSAKTSCYNRSASVTRTGVTYVQYPTNPAHRFGLKLVNGQWKTSEVVGSPGGVFGVETYYTGRYD